MKKYYRFIIITSILLFSSWADITAQNAEFISHHQKSRFYVELKDQSLCWNEGFSETVSGDEIDYYSENPNAKHALITRAGDGSKSIEWKTAPVQKISDDGNVTFVWLAGINCNTNVLPLDGSQRKEIILYFEKIMNNINGGINEHLLSKNLNFSLLYCRCVINAGT